MPYQYLLKVEEGKEEKPYGSSIDPEPQEENPISMSWTRILTFSLCFHTLLDSVVVCSFSLFLFGIGFDRK